MWIIATRDLKAKNTNILRHLEVCMVVLAPLVWPRANVQIACLFPAETVSIRSNCSLCRLKCHSSDSISVWMEDELWNSRKGIATNLNHGRISPCQSESFRWVVSRSPAISFSAKCSRTIYSLIFMLFGSKSSVNLKNTEWMTFLFLLFQMVQFDSAVWLVHSRLSRFERLWILTEKRQKQKKNNDQQRLPTEERWKCSLLAVSLSTSPSPLILNSVNSFVSVTSSFKKWTLWRAMC